MIPRTGCRQRKTDQRGIALAVALFALVLIGALVSGSLFAGRLEQQSGQNSMFAAQALATAEAGLDAFLVNGNPAVLEALPIGALPLDLGVLVSGAGVSATGHVARLTSSLFLLRSTGTRMDADGRPLAVRPLGLFIRILPAEGGAPAGLSVIGERAWVQLP